MSIRAITDIYSHIAAAARRAGAAALSALLLAACADEAPSLPGGDPAEGYITVTLTNTASTPGRPPRAAASRAGGGAETALERVLLAFWPAAAAGDVPAAATRIVELPAGSSATAEARVLLTDQLVADLFGATGTDRCKVMAVANVPRADLEALGQTPTADEIRSLAVGSTFDTSLAESSFVMTGTAEAAYTAPAAPGGRGRATAAVALRRTAARIAVNISLPASVTQGEGEGAVTWTPATGDDGKSGMQLLLSNGVARSVACPANDDTRADDDYYNITAADTGLPRTFTLSSEAAHEKYPYRIDNPFYTYPNRWEETPSERHRTTMTLMVPWKREGEAEYRTFYYQVPVSGLPEITANYAYTVNLSVNMLGSENPDEPMLLTDLSYNIVDWAQAAIDVDIKDMRYLVLNERDITVDNLESVSIPFYSSHPVEITDITLSYNRYNFVPDIANSDCGKVVTIPISKEQIDLSVSGTDSLCSYRVSYDKVSRQMTLEIKHPLKIWNPVDAAGEPVPLTGYNDASAATVKTATDRIYRYVKSDPYGNAYSPYTIHVEFAHEDDPSFSESVTITQIPGMSIEAIPNNGGWYAWAGAGYTGLSTVYLHAWYENFGYVFVNSRYLGTLNGTYEYRPNDINPPVTGTITVLVWEVDNYLGGLPGNNKHGTNNNNNMYIVHISSLSGLTSTDTPYIIGDPRSDNINNTLVNAGYDAATDKNDGTLAAGASTAAASWTYSNAALYQGTRNRQLTYYYPTVESENAEWKWRVAPKFRIASSYGTLNVGRSVSRLTKAGARRRCASYQEQGCPAGRWRLPTWGELFFMARLCVEGKIPPLFIRESTTSGGTYYRHSYMSAQGPVKIDLANGTVTSGDWSDDLMVLPVYDEWYWELETDYVLDKDAQGRYSYTWGDMPKRNVQGRLKRYAPAKATKGGGR